MTPKTVDASHRDVQNVHIHCNLGVRWGQVILISTINGIIFAQKQTYAAIEMRNNNLRQLQTSQLCVYGLLRC